MSVSTLRKNFYRIVTLVIDHGADSMRCLLDHFIQKKFLYSFKDFVSSHQHEIYHYYNNVRCCQCSNKINLPYTRVIHNLQVETLFNKNGPKHPNHKQRSQCEFCCSTVKENLKLTDIDITLLRFFLITYFQEEFWKNCLSSGLLFDDFLNENKHEIFHLRRLDAQCCLCTEIMTKVETRNDKLSTNQWEKMFATKNPYPIHSKTCVNKNNPCSVTATVGINPHDLDDRTKTIILSNFSSMMKHIDRLINTRNKYAHAVKAELPDEDFQKIWNVIEDSIIYLSKFTNTHQNRAHNMSELKEKSLEEAICLELQCLLQRTALENENCQKTFELVNDKLANFQTQLLNVEDTVMELSECSGSIRNIIDNSRTEIEFHVQDKTYVRTSAVSAACEKLHSSYLLILTGRAGSGKSVTALEIASVFHDKGYTVLKVEQNLALDFKIYFKSEKKQLIIFEDLFGKSDVRYNEDLHANLLNVLTPHVHNGTSKFIMTVRSYAIDDVDDIVKSHQVLSEAVLVNLNGNFRLSKLEMNQILTVHAHHKDIEIDECERQKIITSDPYLGFPETCRLFCSFKNFSEMGHTFFTSPTKELQKEISNLKRSGYTDNVSALQYCVLVSLMLYTSYGDNYGIKIGHKVHEHIEPLPCVQYILNVNSHSIEYLLNSIFNKTETVISHSLDEICKGLTNRYIQKDINSNVYVFQHHTVFDAVLFSYWDITTMDEFIKNCSIEILAEYVRPFDCPVKRNTRYLNVPRLKCSYLAETLLQTCISDCLAIDQCKKVVNKSEFTLNLLNQELHKWFTIKEHVLNCEWSTLIKLVRPSDYIKATGMFAQPDDTHIIERLVIELGVDIRGVIQYIESYGSEKFVNDFNEKLSDWFQSGEHFVNCTWYLIDNFVRPNTFKIEKCKIGTIITDRLLIDKLINELVNCKIDRTWEVKQYIESYCSKAFIKGFNEKLTNWLHLKENVKKSTWGLIYFFVRPTSEKIKKDNFVNLTSNICLIQRLIDELIQRKTDRAVKVKQYIERFGNKDFVKDFKEKLTEWYQSEEHLENCKWGSIHNFVRPFKIEVGKLCIQINKSRLIQRLIREVVTPGGDKASEVKYYIEQYGCDDFIMAFHEKLSEYFHSEESVLFCKWDTISNFIRPTTYEIESKRSTLINDGWLIKRLLNESLKSECDNACEVKQYIEMYGCDKFVHDFNKKLMEYLKSEDNCTWELIYNFVRPTTFNIQKGKLGTHKNNSWLIQQLLKILTKPKAKAELQVKDYIEMYGCEDFVQNFNEKLEEWLQSEVHVTNCTWVMLYNFIRPTTFKFKRGEVGSFTTDRFLIQRIITEFEENIDRIRNTKQYVELYGNEEFVKDLNLQLAEWFNLEGDATTCMLMIINHFVRPTSFKLKHGVLGIHTNDMLLVQRLIKELMEPNIHRAWNNCLTKKHRNELSKLKENRVMEIKEYIKEYGSTQFIAFFNKKLKEFVMPADEKKSGTCNKLYMWTMIYHFVRPSKIEFIRGEMGICISDECLIKNIINELIKPKADKISEVTQYIEKYGCEEFVNNLNIELKVRFLSMEVVDSCTWDTIDFCIRPSTFNFENGKIGTFTNDSWLINKIINILLEPRVGGNCGNCLVRRNELIQPNCTRKIEVIQYIEKYGCEKFVLDFNIKLSQFFQVEENVEKCSWIVIHYLVRPTTISIVKGKIGITINNSWLITRLINELLTGKSGRVFDVEEYIEKFGCKDFVKDFSKKLHHTCQQEGHEVYYPWYMIYRFVRPTTSKTDIDKMCTLKKDSWLIQRLFNELVNPEIDRVFEVRWYMDNYGCQEFCKQFKEKLAQWVQSEKNVAYSSWTFIYYFVRPKAFKSELDYISMFTNDRWLIQRLINELVTPQSDGAGEVKQYIKKYGCEEFIYNFNERLNEWCKSEENVANCTWYFINNFVRPVTSKIENGSIGTFTNDSWLIQRLINELVAPISDNHDNVIEVQQYIDRFACKEFVTGLKGKLTSWLKSASETSNYSFDLIYYFIRPNTCDIDNLKSVPVAVANDRWLTHIFKNKIIEPTAEEARKMKRYIKKYGNKEFATNLMESVSERFQSQENVLNSTWSLIYNCIRPTTYKIDNEKLETHTNDNWLIKRLINELVKPNTDSTLEVKRYIEEYGCEKFVNTLNSKLSEWCKSKENVLECVWDFICHFVRPPMTTIEEGKICIFTKKSWLIQRLINEVMKPNGRELQVKEYIEMYGCHTFVQHFNEKLMECFQSVDNVNNCALSLIFYFVRPKSFGIETGEVGTGTIDRWLIQRLTNELLKPKSDKILQVNQYILKYGSENFVNDMNTSIKDRCKSEENILSCSWLFICDYVCPTSSTNEYGKLCTHTNNCWLIRRLINELINPQSKRVLEVRQYIEKHRCDDFVQDFNNKLEELFQSKENVQKCSWHLIDCFVRPFPLNIENGEVGTVTNYTWLTERLINELVKPRDDKVLEVLQYTEKYRSEALIKHVDQKLTDRFQSEVNVANCSWNLIYYTVRPTTFKFENAHISIYTNDNWLIQRLITELVRDKAGRDCEVKRYTEKFGCVEFNRTLREKIIERNEIVKGENDSEKLAKFATSLSC